MCKYENDEINCPKCGKKIILNKDKINDIIIRDNKIKNNINEIKLILDKIKKNYQNELIETQFKNIKELLIMMNKVNNLNIKNLLNLFSENEIKDKKDIIQKDILVTNSVNPNILNQNISIVIIFNSKYK